MTDRPSASRPSAPSPPTFSEYFALVREDRRTHDGHWTSPGFQAILAIRTGHLIRSIGNPLLRKLVTISYRVLRRRARDRFGIEVDARMTVGRRVKIVHQSAIVFHQHSVIGDDCLIRHSVTVGGLDTWRAHECPTLGNNVQVGAGAVLIGQIIVGDNARIGPNAVVTTDVPAGTLVVAPRSVMVER